MSIDSPEDLEALAEIGRLVGLTIKEVAARVRPGVKRTPRTIAAAMRLSFSMTRPEAAATSSARATTV